MEKSKPNISLYVDNPKTNFGLRTSLFTPLPQHTHTHTHTHTSTRTYILVHHLFCLNDVWNLSYTLHVASNYPRLLELPTAHLAFYLIKTNLVANEKRKITTGNNVQLFLKDLVTAVSWVQPYSST